MSFGRVKGILSQGDRDEMAHKWRGLVGKKAARGSENRVFVRVIIGIFLLHFFVICIMFHIFPLSPFM